MTRLGLLLLAATALVAADPVLDGTWSFQALGGADLSFQPDRPATATGGVTATFQGLRLEGDRLDYLLAQLPTLQSLTVATASLIPSTAPGARVLLDSSAASLAQFPIKGRLTPVRLDISRLDSPATVVRWQVDLHDLGDANLQIQDQQGWTWHHVWAHQARLHLEAPILNRQLGPLRPVQAWFIGRDDPATGPVRMARLDRFGPTEPAPGVEPLGGAEAATIHLAFDAEGRMSAKLSGVSRMHGQGLLDFKRP